MDLQIVLIKLQERPHLNTPETALEVESQANYHGDTLVSSRLTDLK